MKTKLTISFLLIVSIKTVHSQHLPPQAPVKMVTEEYFGQKVHDPYRYMENMEDPEVLAWFKVQSDYARSVLNSLPGRRELIEKMRALDARKSARVYRLAITKNDRYFYLKKTPDDETGKLFFRQGFQGSETLLFDPETYGHDTIAYAIIDFEPSLDGTKVALVVAPGGSENGEIVVLNADSQAIIVEKIDHVWMPLISWLPDGERFFYNRVNSQDIHDPDRLINTKVYLHVLGTSPAEDIEIFSNSKYPQLGVEAGETPFVVYDENTDCLFALAFSSSTFLKGFFTHVRNLSHTVVEWKPLFTMEDKVRDFITSEEDVYLLSASNADNYKILKISISDPDLSKAKTVVEENAQARITSTVLTKDGLYYTLSSNGVKESFYFVPSGKSNSIELVLPKPAGRISLLSKDITSSDIWVTLSGWTTDEHRYKYVPEKNTFISENLSSIADYPEFDSLIVEEVTVSSHDGAEVPLSIIYHPKLRNRGTHPTVLVGYGSYGYSMAPFFDTKRLIWTSLGGIVAVAHVRGGGEKGVLWHEGGMKERKPNSWKDFIACAEYLVKEGYTTPRQIAALSGSAGGILLGMAMIERPNLFGCVVSMVGWMNPLSVSNDPMGESDIPEFGNVQDSAGFFIRKKMDPYHNLITGEKYPATLLTAGMNDPRVLAFYPAKFAARLQVASASDQPVLFLVDFESGHGIGDANSKEIERMADVHSFAFWQTGHRAFQPDTKFTVADTE